MYSIDEIKTIGIIGSGVMGHGIAIVASNSGFNVVLFDLNDEVLEKAKIQIEKFTQSSVEKGKSTPEQRNLVLSRIQYTCKLESLKDVEFLVEATPEKLEIKHELFLKLEKICNDKTIFASNTSSIPITQIGSRLEKPSRCIGWHFFNPAPMMKLVEVIPGEDTSTEVLNSTILLTKKLGKTSATVSDTPGFIVNRVARFYYLESLRMLEEGVSDVETIDKIMEGTGFKMGPFKLVDLIGVETNHEVSKSLYHSFYEEPRFRPSRIQQKKVEAKHWGRKSGKGFYNYSK